MAYSKMGLWLILIVGATATAAEPDKPKEKSYENMSIEELMSVSITVASNKPKTINQSPGVVSLITSDEIAHMGARDLMDVLATVPGFSDENDEYDVINPTFRGLLVDGGKNLFLIDGQEMNERMFQTNPLGRRYPIGLIDRIEIIRGPGSVKYGGTSELCVIKITTKLGAAAKSALSVSVGQQEHGSPDNQIEGMYSKKSDTSSGGGLFSWRGSSLGERDFTDTNGVTYNLKNKSDITDSFAEAIFSKGRFSGQVMYDRYVLRGQYGYGVSLTQPAHDEFSMFATTLNYNYDYSSSISLHPYVNYKRDTPWKWTDEISVAEVGSNYDRAVDHFEVGLLVNYDPNPNVNWLFGLTTYEDSATDYYQSPFIRDNKYNVKFADSAIFSEVNYDLGWSELTAGLRFDSGRYGQALVPRIALVKDYHSWGYKVLLSEDFRPPGVENIEDRDGALPLVTAEKSQVAELELSKQINEKSNIAINLFSMVIKNPIVYFFQISAQNPTGDNYENTTQTGSNGAEVSYQFRNSNNNLKATYSYYETEKNIAIQGVPGHDKAFLGVPNWKLTLLDTIKIYGDTYFITPTVVYNGPRFSYEWSSAAAANVIEKLDETVYANLIFEKRDFLRKDMQFTFGVYNLLNVNYRVPVPYQGGGESVPTQSRDYIAKLATTF